MLVRCGTGFPMNWKNLSCGLALVFFLMPALSVPFYSQSPYYQGKTVTILVSTDAGGTADLWVKALAAYLQKYIPGNPTIVTEYMPGGGGRRAANHFNTAPQHAQTSDGDSAGSDAQDTPRS